MYVGYYKFGITVSNINAHSYYEALSLKALSAIGTLISSFACKPCIYCSCREVKVSFCISSSSISSSNCSSSSSSSSSSTSSCSSSIVVLAVVVVVGLVLGVVLH